MLDGSGSPLIAFPSFHAASGVLYVWAGWRLRRFRPILVLINVPMIAATPIIGGHYLADMVAGAAVAVAAAVLTERLYPACVLVAVLLRDLGQAPGFRPAAEGVGAA